MNLLLTIAAVLACLVLAYSLYAYVLRLLLTMPATHDEVHRVTTEDGWTITLFRHKAAREGGEPVLLCHGAFANRLNLVMPERRGIAYSLMDAGYDCWAIEYRGSESGQPPPGVSKTTACLDDYLLYDLPAAIDYIRVETGHPKLHWVGHSMGGMLLYAFDELYGSDALASATTLGAPVGFASTRVRPEPFLLALHRRFPGFFLTLVRGLIPIARPLRLPIPLLPVNAANIDPALPTRHLYCMIGHMENRVIHDLHDIAVSKEWRMDGGNLDVTAGLPLLETPLFVILAVADPFVPTAEGEAFFQRIVNPDKQLLILSRANGYSADYNHVDLSMAPQGRYEVCAAIVDWIRAHPVADRKLKSLAQSLPPPGLPSDDGDAALLITPGGRTHSAAKRKPAAKKKAVAKKKAAVTAPTMADGAPARKAPARKKAAAKKKPAARSKATPMPEPKED